MNFSGTSFPLGATIGLGGVNFSVFSKYASRIIDTALDSPDDVCAWADAATAEGSSSVVARRRS